MDSSENTLSMPATHQSSGAMPVPSRRALLTGAAGAALAIAAPLAVEAAMPHPDAELLAAWEAYVAGFTALEFAPEDDDEREHFWAPIDAAGAKIETIPARTHAGYAVKLRYLFDKFDGSAAGQDFALFNGPQPDTLQDAWLGMLWSMVEHAELVGGASC